MQYKRSKVSALHKSFRQGRSTRQENYKVETGAVFKKILYQQLNVNYKDLYNQNSAICVGGDLSEPGKKIKKLQSFKNILSTTEFQTRILLAL
jgi:uncharacterized protein YaaR (DUF327 family)